MPTLNNTKQTTRKAIGLAVKQKKPEIIALFQKHGVTVDSSYSNDELIVAILQAIKSSPRFRKDLAVILAQVVKENTKSFNEDPTFYGFGLTPDETAAASSGTGTGAASAGASSSSPNLWQSLVSSGAVGSVLNTGLTTLSNSLKSSSDKKLADTALQIELEKTKQAQLLSTAPGATTAKGMSTGAKIAIGIGVAGLLGVVVWLVVKSSGKKAAA